MKCDENLGRVRASRLDISAAALNNFHGVFKWKGCDDDDIRVCRATLFTERAMPETNDNWQANIRAKVSFGVGAIKSDVFVDWRNGAQLSVCSHYLDVSVAIVERSGVIDADDALQLFGAMVNHGGDAQRSINTLTTPIQTIEPAAIAIYDIPPFAYAYTVMSQDQTFFTFATILLAQTAAGDGGVFHDLLPATQFQTSGAMVNGRTLHSSARRILIQNGAAGATTAAVQFFIAV